MDEIENRKAPGWRFRITEVSAGAYKVDGFHTDGRSVSRYGGDPEAVLSDCIRDAQALPLRRFVMSKALDHAGLHWLPPADRAANKPFRRVASPPSGLAPEGWAKAS
jgi:hypothetical protein